MNAPAHGIATVPEGPSRTTVVADASCCTSLTGFRERVETAWSIDTTYCVETYAGSDPAHGQCAVTSVLLQDVFGGELMRGRAVGPGFDVWHYWNRLQGLDIDLTWRQFAVGTVILHPEVTARSVLLANRWMTERYENLRLAASCGCASARVA